MRDEAFVARAAIVDRAFHAVADAQSQPEPGPCAVRIRKPGVVLRLMLTVMRDTLRSNRAVVGLLLGLFVRGKRRHAAGFVRVQLDMRDPNALAALAMIVCITPGTAWAELSFDRATLLLHVLELSDAGALAAHIKTSYERPLMEIFE